MTIRIRRWFFWLSFLFFALAVMPVVLYSQGYRFSLKDFKFVYTGGFFIAPTPDIGTRIFVDGKLVKETSFLSRTTFIQNLTPRTYSIRIEKDGYSRWEKNLEIEPEKVTEVFPLLLKNLPERKIVLKGDYTAMAFTDNNRNILELFDKDSRKSYFSLDNDDLIEKPSNLDVATSSIPDLVKTNLIAEAYNGFQYDESTTRLIWWDDHILYLEWLNIDKKPIYISKSRQKLLETPYNIREARFYPEHDAAIVTFSNKAEVIEFDDRGERVLTPLYKGKKPYIETVSDQKLVYILDQGMLIKIRLD